MTQERDYVLGTHDEEIARLGIQHDVWRERAHAAWRRAGFGPGQTIIDVGSGPGYATTDLAALVGHDGRVIAVDRSRRFLDTLDARLAERGYENVTAIESDLDEVQFDRGIADGAWCRWVLAFVRTPRRLLERIAGALKPGGVFVSHEYFDYASWRCLPPNPHFTDFVHLTIANWRNSGGEPDIGLSVPGWAEELGFRIESITPLIDVITPTDFAWRWPTSFMTTGLDRLTSLGMVEPERARIIRAALKEVAEAPNSRMITPGVLEVVARKT
jgi:ubiquinone/menaquinone biosynthesis C-methylase UbiE